MPSDRKYQKPRVSSEADALCSSIIRSVAEGIICLSPEPPYTVRFANPFSAGLLGIKESDLINLPLDSALQIKTGTIQGPDGRLERLKPLDATAFEAEITTSARPNGFFAAITIARTGNYENGMLVLTLQDITLRRQTEQSLRLSSKVFEVSSESIMVTDKNGIIVSVNPAFTWLTGFRPDEVLGKNPSILKSGQHDDAFYAAMWIALNETGQWQGEIWDKRKDGSIYPKWVNIDAVREKGEVSHYVSIAHDISKHKQHEARIQHLAEHDALTGLPNRRVLTEHTNQIIHSQRQSDQHFAVILIDLDRFKNINDTLGHLVGDQVLVETARRLNQAVRSADLVVRLGGDEFVILLTNIEDPLLIAEITTNIQQKLSSPIVIGERSLHTPPSIGIACYPQDGEDVDVLLRNADAAMYQSKFRGGNCWTFYTREINENLTKRLTLEESLREAITNDGLHLHFQPLFDAHSKRVASWEALLRWEHPTLGPISPEQIIPIAEETGLIHDIGRWVIYTACAQIKQWEIQGHGLFRISINVSPTQLDVAGFSEVVLNALSETGVRPEQLELEITESVLISHSVTAKNSLETLREAGILLTLDDFGTGYSSLTYLKSLSIDRIKIDRSFVSNILENKQDASIVQAVVMLANMLNLGLVAEGVETVEQEKFLREHGCPEVQGFLLGKPMPAREVGAFLATLS